MVIPGSLLIFQPKTLQGHSLIAGAFAPPAKKTFRPTSPLDSQPLDPLFPEATFDDADRALHHASEAFALFRRASAEVRAGLLEKIAEEILAIFSSSAARTSAPARRKSVNASLA